MIRAKNLSFTYKNSEAPVVLRANFNIQPGEICLVAGQTGSGKSTLLKMLNGLIPHFANGRLEGQLLIDGKDMTGEKPHEFTNVVGYVNQQPENSFVASTVEDELAFTLEQLGVDREQMKNRIDQVAKLLQISALLDRETISLSGGEQQKVAIAAALIAGQKILLLDEPTSALDDVSARSTIRHLERLAKSEGLTILIAEHRLERVAPIADSLLTIFRDGSVSHEPISADLISQIENSSRYLPVSKSPGVGAIALNRNNINIEFGSNLLLKNSSIQLRHSQITAVVGPNGSGKTSLLWALVGQAPNLAEVAMIPQIATDLLFLSSLRQELHDSDEFSQEPSGTTGNILESLVGRIDPNIHPRDLSTGQQLSLVLAMQLTKRAPVILLDEPTRGLDHEAKQQVVNLLIKLRNEGRAILITSHDQAFVNLVADRKFEISEQRLIEVSS